MSDLAISILQDLVSFKTITPKGRDATEYVAHFLSALGFTIDLKSFGQGAEETTNLYAFRGGGGSNICFAGHLDVVEAGDKSLWLHDPFKAIIDGNKIYGRGAVDMKGAIACALAATYDYVNSGAMGGKTVSFLLTTDEEGSGKYGTVKMLEHISGLYPKIDLCILGEPTSKNEIGDTIKIGRRGSINFNLVITGQDGHVAYPNMVLNPIHVMARILTALSSEVIDEGSDFFEPSGLQITSAEAGDKLVSGVVPRLASASFNVRFNAQHTPTSLLAFIDAIVKKYISGSKYSYDFSYTCSSLPFIQPMDEKLLAVASLVENATGVKAKFDTNGGTSDARFIHKHSTVVELGLKSALAHKINESVEIRDLQKLYNVYYTLLTAL